VPHFLVPRYQGANFSARAAVNPKIKPASCRNDRDLASAFGARRTSILARDKTTSIEGVSRVAGETSWMLAGSCRTGFVTCRSCLLIGCANLGISVVCPARYLPDDLFSQVMSRLKTDNNAASQSISGAERRVRALSWYGAGPNNPSPPIGRKQGDWQPADQVGANQLLTAPIEEQ
jgi:hypothetical protein